ncbi:unnamed protein product [Schistocephalus solidus]|uniref:EF hand n=1 Tax=Schistocephalus solidus TaxID=70667 RepID=A0A183TKK4_SCHSO|nr:unnamed protein product [Schistocephalus solidus]
MTRIFASLPQIDQKTLAMFTEMDTDKSGEISYEEFRAAMLKKSEPGKADEASIRALFDSLDTDKSGELSIEELKKMFTK